MKPSKYNASTLEDILSRNNPGAVKEYIREHFYSVVVVNLFTKSPFNKDIDIQTAVSFENGYYFELEWFPQRRPFCMINDEVYVRYVGAHISGLLAGVHFTGPDNRRFSSLHAALVFVKLQMATL